MYGKMFDFEAAMKVILLVLLWIGWGHDTQKMVSQLPQANNIKSKNCLDLHHSRNMIRHPEQPTSLCCCCRAWAFCFLWRHAVKAQPTAWLRRSPWRKKRRVQSWLEQSTESLKMEIHTLPHDSSNMRCATQLNVVC